MKKRRNKNFRADGFEPVSNEAFASAMADLRRSSATSRHLNPAQKRTRQAAKQLAIRDQF